MDEHIPKTDEEIEWDEFVHDAEKEDSKIRRDRSLFEIGFEAVLESSYKLAILFLIGVGLLTLLIRIFEPEWSLLPF